MKEQNKTFIKYKELPTSGFDFCIICKSKTDGYAFCKKCYKANPEARLLQFLNNPPIFAVDQLDKNIDQETIDYRKKFPAEKYCQDGHYVRSKDERAIDDYLWAKQIIHAYEPKFRLNQEEKEICLKQGKNFDCFYPDFYIPKYNLYIEYFGENEEDNASKNELKIKIFSNRKKINFRFLTFKDSNIILQRLEDILDEFENK